MDTVRVKRVVCKAAKLSVRQMSLGVWSVVVHPRAVVCVKIRM